MTEPAQSETNRYLGDIEREKAEIARAEVEGREADLENPPHVAGTVADRPPVEPEEDNEVHDTSYVDQINEEDYVAEREEDTDVSGVAPESFSPPVEEEVTEPVNEDDEVNEEVTE